MNCTNRRLRSVLRASLLLVISLASANGAALRIPSVSGPLVIDGNLDEALWQHAKPLPLKSGNFGAPFPQGGETRIALRGKYVCVSARLPEPGRIVAASVGRNPNFGPEDLVIWRFYAYVSGVTRTTVALRVNPLGGYSLDYTLPVTEPLPGVRFIPAVEQGEDWRSFNPLVFVLPVPAANSGDHAITAARIIPGEWSVEAAFPLESLSDRLGYMEVERIRSARPEAPRLRWSWPEENVRFAFEFEKPSSSEALDRPLFHPSDWGNQEPEFNVPKIVPLPPLDAGPDNPAWRLAGRLDLRLDNGSARPPKHSSQVLLAHDGETLALFARCSEAETIRAKSRTRDAGLGGDDQLQVLLSISGSEYADISVNAAGSIYDAVGKATGRPSPPASWDSGAVVRTGRQKEGWTLRMNIPLRNIAKVFDEPRLPEQWRILIRRIRPARDDSSGEISISSLTWSSTPYCPARYRRLRLSSRPTQGPSIPATAASQLSQIPENVWSYQQRKKLDLAQMVEKRIKSRVSECARQEREDWEQVKTRADWEHFRDRRYAALKKSLGAFPDRTPLKSAVTRRLDYGRGFVIENLVFESRPQLVVTANLYLPGRIEGKIPAIVAVHCHHAAKTQGELQDMGMNWARAGVAVLVMDQVGAGERVQSQPWLGESYHSRYTLGMQLHLMGDSLMKWMVWDLMRGIDLLTERSYVDPRRIVIIGSVAGGGDPAAVTAVLDSRVAAVVPFNFGEAGPEEHYIRGPREYDFETAWPGWGSWETTRNLRRSIIDQFPPWFICASVAPRGFVYAFESAWPKGVENQPPWPRYRKVFQFYGREDRLATVEGFGPFPSAGERPNVGTEHRHGIYPILNRWLGFGVPRDEYHDTRPDSELECLTPQAAAERSPKTASEIALTLARQRLSSARSRREALAPSARVEQLRTALAAKLGDIEPSTVASEVVWSKEYSGFRVDAVALETDVGIKVPLLLLRPANDSRVPVVLGLAQAGKDRFLFGRQRDIELLLKKGVAVCIGDVRGTGETAWTRSRAPGSMTLPVVEFMLGGTMLGKRLKDARTVLHYLAHRADLDPARIGLWGDSFAQVNSQRLLLDQSVNRPPGPQAIHQAEPLGGLLALLGALYENGVRAVAVRRGLVSYLSVLNDRFAYVPQDAIIPGILEVADIEDIISALAPRALLLEELVDGRNRVVPKPEAGAELSNVRRLYRSPPLGVAAWLSEQLAR